MKLKDLIKLSMEEEKVVVDQIMDKMTALGYQELVARMKYLIDTVVPDQVVGNTNFKQRLLDDNNFDVSFEGGKIKSVRLYFYLYDGIEANLSIIGFNASFTPEHEDTKDLIKVDGFDEFIKMTDVWKE